MSPEEIVAYLEEHPHSTVKDIGTDNPTMYALEKKGAVRKDGTAPPAGRGRPATLWIVANGEAAAEVEAPGAKGRGTPEHVAKMHEGKRRAAAKRAKEEAKGKKDALKRLKTDLPGYQKKYDASLKKCRKAKTDEEIRVAFNESDNAQNAVLSTLRQIRILEAETSMTLDDIKKTWNEADPADQDYLLTAITMIPASWLARKYWVRKGAPPWAARAIAALSAAIYIAPYRYAANERKYERERRERKVAETISAADVLKRRRESGFYN